MDANVDPQENRPNRSALRALTSGRLAYSIEEFAEATDIGRVKLYEEINAGRLKAKKLGARTLIMAADGADWLDALPDKAIP